MPVVSRARWLAVACLFTALSSTITASPADATKVEGIYLKAFLATYADFISISDMTDRQRNLDGYTVEFKQDATHIYVYFSPKRTEGEAPVFGGRLLNGRLIRYTVDKGSYKILKRAFFQ